MRAGAEPAIEIFAATAILALAERSGVPVARSWSRYAVLPFDSLFRPTPITTYKLSV